jgi:protein SCO1/2
MKLRWIGLLVVLAGCGSRESSLPYYVSEQLTPEWMSDDAVSDSSMHTIADFSLTNQRGVTVTRANLNGKISIAHFFFTRCAGVCPKTQPNLAGLLRKFPGDPRIQILSQSVKPEEDSVAQLVAYATEHHVTDARWNFLTGSRSEIERLARDSYFANLNDGRSYGINDLVHTETVFLVDPHGRIRGVYNGTLELDIDRLVDDIKVLMKEIQPRNGELPP